MIAASQPIQRPPHAKLLIIDARGEISHVPRTTFIDLLRPGDLVMANDAATLPASLRGEHVHTATAVAVRLAGRRSLAPESVKPFSDIIDGPSELTARPDY